MELEDALELSGLHYPDSDTAQWLMGSWCTGFAELAPTEFKVLILT